MTKKIPSGSRLNAKLEKIIEKDIQACEELQRTGAGLNEWVEKNCKRMKSWQEAAEAGDARGQLLCGLGYVYGYGAKEDSKKAAKWFTKSAKQGNAQGQFYLGKCYHFGQGIKEDKKKAVEWFTKAAEQGDADAQFSLGYCYHFGEGVEEDKKKAAEWFAKAAEQGHAQGAMSDEKVLTKEIAEQFSADEGDMELSEFTAIEDEAAECLVGMHCGALELDGLTSISDAAALSLSKHKGELDLTGVSALSLTVAQTLAAHEGALRLDLGMILEQSGYAVVAELRRHPSVMVTVVDGKRFIPLFRALSMEFEEDWELIGAEIADSVSRYRHEDDCPYGDDWDDCFEFLQAAAGRMIWALSDSCVTYELRRYQFYFLGNVEDVESRLLDGLTSLSDVASQFLLEYEGVLHLHNLVDLSDAAAEYLCKYTGGIELNLDMIPESARSILQKHHSFVDSLG